MNKLLKVSMSLAVMLSGVFAMGEDLTIFDGKVGSINNTEIVKDPVNPDNLVAKSKNSSMLVKDFTKKDLSGYKGISFSYYTDSNEGLIFFLDSANPETEGSDYYMKKLKMNTGKWETVVVPFDDSLTKGRKPLGFSKIEKIIIYLSGWDLKYNKEGNYYFDNIVLLKELPKATK